ncbi:MAG: VOC family protein [Myxococcota bacterium]
MPEEGAPSASTGVGRNEWLFATPELPVADVRATQAYYRDVFGFRIAWVYEERYGAVYNGRTEVYLRQEPGPIERACVFVRVENADRVLDAYRARGANVVEEIASRPWGMREFTVEELNGHRFRIGHSCGPVRASDEAAEQG